jgi:dTDP-4-amino-4,6-dideoxygalactose transaminase
VLKWSISYAGTLEHLNAITRFAGTRPERLKERPMIPMMDLAEQYRTLQPEIDRVMREVAASGHYILGPHVAEFEHELAAFLGAPRALGCASGTDALILSLKALGVGPGDEVVTSPFSFIATSGAISLCGAQPVFADVDPLTLNPDPRAAEAAVTLRTRALLPVHLFGRPAAMPELLALSRRRGLALVEDAAQAVGARHSGRACGTWGDAGCFSFYPSKNLGAMGDGGMVLCADPALHERVDLLRRHGGRARYEHERLGMNSRLDEVQAAILRVKLRRLAQWTEARRQAAARYDALLAEIPDLSIVGGALAAEPPAVYTVYHQYTVRVPHRDAVATAMKEQGVATMVYYPIPLHLQVVNQHLGYREGSMPEAERAAREVLSLPISPELTEQTQVAVVTALKTALAAASRRTGAAR